MLISSMLLSFLGIGTLWIVSASQVDTNNVQAVVLKWWTFTDSAQDKWGALDCNSSQIKSYIKDDVSRKTLFDSTDSAQSWIRSDVKWCLMESKVDKYATWFIFLWIAVLVWYLIFLGIKIAIGSEGEGGGHGWMPGGGMPWMPGQWGGWVWDKIKPSVIGIWVLTFVLVGWLNALLLLMKFVVDLFIK